MTQSRSKSSRLWRIIIGISIGVVAVLAIGSIYLYNRVNMPFPGDESQRIYISSTMTEPEIRDYFISTLGPQYGDRVFGLWKFFKGTPGRSKGSYVLEPGMKAYKAAKIIATGRQTPVRLTFNNIRLLPALAVRVDKALETDSASFMRAVYEILPQRGYSEAEFPAAFIPDTYEFYWTASTEDVVKTLVNARDKVWNESRRAKAQQLGLTPAEVATVASIIEEETAKKDERPRIARLYLNRLNKGMPLQADPTVKFAVGDFSIRRVTGKHLAVSSPYNTYKISGLPPGPIRVPELTAIDAVLDAPAHQYLYMCAKEDFSGYHNFAADYNTHLQNARRYQRALDARGIK